MPHTGIEDENFSYIMKHEELVQLNLVCAICHGIMSDAEAACPCGHSFCQDCLRSHQDSSEGNAGCPICRCVIETTCSNLTARDQVKSLQVLCSLCGWKGFASGVETHIEKCEERYICCPFKDIGCKVKLPRRMMVSHCERNYCSHMMLMQTKVLKLDGRVDDVAEGVKDQIENEVKDQIDRRKKPKMY